MSALNRLLPVVLGVAGAFVMGSSVSQAEDVDMKKVMDELKALRSEVNQTNAKNAELAKQLAAVKAGGDTKASANAAVDKALGSRGGSDKFFHDPCIHDRAIQIGGLVDVSYQFNFARPGEKFNTLRVFDNNQTNDFSVQQANVFFDGTAKERGQAGFMIDLGFGRDNAVGNGLTSDNVIQAYVNYIAPIGCNGLEFQFGKFVTPMGFEVAKGDNWNVTRSLNFGWTQPLSHTGAMLGYQVFKNWHVSAAVVNSFYNESVNDNNNGKTIHLASNWQPLKQLNWTIQAMIGNEENRISDVNGFGGTSATAITGTSPAALAGFNAAAPTYVLANGTTATLRSPQDSTTFTVNNIVKWDPGCAETLHFGFEWNWQMKEGYNYKKDDLITEVAAPTFTPTGSPTFPGNSSFNSVAAAIATNNATSGIATDPAFAIAGTGGGLTARQYQALYRYYHGSHGNAYTYGAAIYAKWDFAKSWYLGVRGEFVSDQDNLNFRNDAGVIAQNTYLAGAKTNLQANMQSITGGPLVGTYGPITTSQYNKMIKSLDHRDNVAWSATATVGWNITKALKMKMEYRHDQASQDVFYSRSSHQTNALPGWQLTPTATTSLASPGTQIKSGYVPGTTGSQDTAALQFQYSF